MVWVIVLIAVVVVGGILLLRARQPERESVDSFRRQIDALSPEARRPVVDQVQKQAEIDETQSETETETDDEDDTDGA